MRCFVVALSLLCCCHAPPVCDASLHKDACDSESTCHRDSFGNGCSGLQAIQSFFAQGTPGLSAHAWSMTDEESEQKFDSLGMVKEMHIVGPFHRRAVLGRCYRCAVLGRCYALCPT